jgi:hypothetical protein
VVAENCREWESKNTPEIEKLWSRVFSAVDCTDADGELAGSAAQMASDVLELVLHCVDPALRNPDGSACVSVDRIENCLSRLSLNLKVLEELAKKTIDQQK